MEQVFFRLHVRFVSTVTRLLSPKTRRVLEYVTLGNAFLLVVSLTWLHTRFVNPKGGQGSAVSCLPAALERAGVDPAQLHVLQIHIRIPPDDRGGGGDGGGNGSGGRRRHLPIVPSSDDSSGSCGPVPDGSGDYARQSSDRTRHGDDRDAIAPDARDSTESLGSDGVGSEEGVGGSVGGGGEGKVALRSASGGDPDGSGGGSVAVGDDSPPEVEPPSQPPEIFYSMKLVTGKDAVGTLSGPVTLGIDRFVGKAARGAGDGAESGGAGGGGGGGCGGAVCGGVAEEKRTTVVQSLMDAFSWGKGEAAAVKGGSAATTEGEGHRAVGSLKSGEGPVVTLDTACAATGEATPLCAATSAAAAAGQEILTCQEPQRGGGMAAGGGEGGAGNDERVQDEVYLYSLEKGFLMLRPDLRRKHGIVTANVTVSAHDSCMGGTVVQTLVKDFIGYDTVVMNWLISLYGGRGFLYGVHNNELFNLNYAAEFIESTEDIGKFLVFKIGVMFTTLFLFFTTTTLVSFTLRETQERMLKFTFLLQHHVRHRLPYAPLIFTHVVESLVFVPIMVGILFFLFEFFSDQLLAFMVLSVVWLCEVYSVVSVRTSVCIRFFPQVFFLYFTLFHVYFFSFPFGFSYLALVTTVLFLQHSMLFCWNRYEVPALRAGVISAARPRQAGMVIGVVPRYDPHGMGLPLMPQPGGVDAGVTAPGRPRAATASLLEEPREFITPASRAIDRAILRSNSSPAPGTFSQLFGGGRSSTSINDHGEDTAAPAVPAAAAGTLAAAVAASPAFATPEASSPAADPEVVITPPAARRSAAEWPHLRSGRGGDVGSLDTPVENSTGGVPVSVPLLGTFPYFVWDGIQTSADERREPTPATATVAAAGATIRAPNAGGGERDGSARRRDSAFSPVGAGVEGEGRGARRYVLGGSAGEREDVAPGSSAGGRIEQAQDGEGGGEEKEDGIPRSSGRVALPAPANAPTDTVAGLTAPDPAAALGVDAGKVAAGGGGGGGGAAAAPTSALGGVRQRGPEGTTNPPVPSLNDAGRDLRAELGSSQIFPAAAAATAAVGQERGAAGGADSGCRDLDGAVAEGGRPALGSGVGVASGTDVVEDGAGLLPTGLSPMGTPPGPAEGAGELFGGGLGQGRQLERRGGVESDTPQEERGSLREEEGDDDGNNSGLPWLSPRGNAGRCLEDDGSGSSGCLIARESSATGSPGGR